jgi:hypothetical protein
MRWRWRFLIFRRARWACTWPISRWLLDPGIVVIGGGLMDHEVTTPEFRERYLRIIRETAQRAVSLGATAPTPSKLFPPINWAIPLSSRPSARRSWRCIKAVVVSGRGHLYQIPKQYLPTPGQPVVDFGHCLLRLDAAG